MERARAAASVALFAVFVATTAAIAVAAPILRPAALEPAAVVGWPPATLVVTEIQTGGGSASDEFAEIGNMGSTTVDLAGLEIVYVTSSGGTVTRKAAWTAPTPLDPGRHLLIANGLGAYVSVADATYSGGFAATGGTIVLRTVDGAPIDAVGWGDATNTFVEGSPMAAPPAGSSLERRPGGTGGNTTDTNDNLADLFVQAAPNPQNLAAPPVPAPGPTGTPSLTPSPTPPGPSPSPTAPPTTEPSASAGPTPDPGSPQPTATPVPTPSPGPTVPSSPSPTPDPTSDPTPSPSPTPAPTEPPTPSPSPTPSPTASPTASPTLEPSPSPATLPILEARTLPDGSSARIEGTLTTDLGALESGRSGFVQDATAGIAVYLDAALETPIQAGTRVRLEGTLDERYGAWTLRVAAGTVTVLGQGFLPDPGDVETGVVAEELEAVRVTVTGTTVGSPTAYADGLGILVDDGSGPVRVIVGPDALGALALPSGTLVRATGPVGQRDSTGTGTSGYRIHATEPGELELLEPSPTPSPSPSPSPASSPPPTSSPAPTPIATPSPMPSPSPEPAITIAEARTRPVGAVVTVIGEIAAEAGRIGTPPLLAIGDGTGGILVRVPEGQPAPARGTRITVTGPLAAPYGQLEIRPAPSGFRALGPGLAPPSLEIDAADLGEGTEGRLVALVGTVTATPRKSTSGDLAIDLVDASGTPFRVMADASSLIEAGDLQKGATYRLVGIVGQRASKKDALDGYRVWLRDRGDIVAIPGGSPWASSSPSGGPDASILTIAAARRLDDDAPAVVEGVVTAGAGLLDDGRRIVIQDSTGGIEVYLAAGDAAPAAGTRIRVAGTVGRAWGAPRLRAVEVTVLGAGADLVPRILAGAPGEAVEWQLVRIAGTITSVTRLGDRWRAEVRVGGASVLVTGLAGAGIASTALIEGRAVTVVGIVRRPYPSATDRRFSVVPRGPGDLAVGPAAAGGAGGSGGGAVGSGGAGGAAGAGTSPSPYADLPTVDLATLAEHRGEVVRIGGLVVARSAAGFTIDDGTAIGRVELLDEAAAFLELIDAGDALGIVGRVESRPSGELVVVATDPAGLVRLGSLGETVPLAAGAGPEATPLPSGAAVAAAGMAGPFGGLDGGWLGLIGVVLASMGSLALTIARRRRVHLGLRRVVAARLAGLGSTSPGFGPAAPSFGPAAPGSSAAAPRSGPDAGSFGDAR